MTKTWLITGTSTGFGRALATLLAQKADVRLVATARHPEQLDYLTPMDHGQILRLPLDVTQPDQIKSVLKTVHDRWGTIDVLVNNAGIGYFGTFEESDLSAVQQMFAVNVWGLIHLTRAVLPEMRQQHAGTIVNFSSIGGLYSFPTLSYYHATKYAVEGMSESLEKEVRDLGIKVMLIEPSGFRTDWAGRSSQKTLPTHPDYQPLASFIQDNAQGAHHEAGDPQAAAQIIYDQVTHHQAELPLRLPLGEFAVKTALQKVQAEAVAFKANYELSASADRPLD